MKKLNTSHIAPGISMPVKSGTLSHLQDAYTEAITEGLKGLIGPTYNANKVYILNGLERSGSGDNWIIAPGSVFYQGEVLLSDGTNGAPAVVTSPNVLLGYKTTTFFASPIADPVEFTDGVERSVHLINKLTFGAGIAGTGQGNYVDFERINSNQAQTKITGAGIAVVTGAYPDRVVTVPDNNKILRTGSIPIGDMNSDDALDGFTTRLPSGSNNQCSYSYLFPAAIGHANYKVMAIPSNNSITTDGGFDVNYGVSVQIGQKTDAGFLFSVSVESAAGSNVQNIGIDYIVIANV